MKPTAPNATNVKLSDAISETWNGHTRQVRFEYQVRERDYQTGQSALHAACALGAACYAVWPERQINNRAEAEELFPQLRDYVPRYKHPFPVQDIKVVSLGDLITYYNDRTVLSQVEIIEAVKGLGY